MSAEPIGCRMELRNAEKTLSLTYDDSDFETERVEGQSGKGSGQGHAAPAVCESQRRASGDHEGRFGADRGRRFALSVGTAGQDARKVL